MKISASSRLQDVINPYSGMTGGRYRNFICAVICVRMICGSVILVKIRGLMKIWPFLQVMHMVEENVVRTSGNIVTRVYCGVTLRLRECQV